MSATTWKSYTQDTGPLGTDMWKAPFPSNKGARHKMTQVWPYFSLCSHSLCRCIVSLCSYFKSFCCHFEALWSRLSLSVFLLCLFIIIQFNFWQEILTVTSNQRLGGPWTPGTLGPVHCTVIHSSIHASTVSNYFAQVMDLYGLKNQIPMNAEQLKYTNSIKKNINALMRCIKNTWGQVMRWTNTIHI